MAQWIVSDVDGCLCPEESEAWDLATFARLCVVTRAAAAGRSSLAPLALCTGRPQPYVEALMKLLDVRAPAVCESGAVLYTLQDNRAWHGPGVTAEKLAGLRAVRAYVETVLPAHPGVVYQAGKEAQLSYYSATPELLRPLDDAIGEFVAREGLPPLIRTRSHYYLNVAMEGVDKGRALEWLMGELGISRDEVVGIGDTEGDLPLRDRVGFFACPANATPGIRAVADYVSPKPIADGVLDILARPECQRP